MILEAETGMGNFLTRAARSIAYSLQPSDKRQQCEQLIAGLVGEARWFNNHLDLLSKAPAGPARERLEVMLGAAEALLRDINSDIRSSAEAAKADGHNLRIEGNSVGLGLGPVLAVVVVALGAVAIVASYWSFNSMFAKVADWLGTKSAIDAFIAANRADLAARVVLPQSSGPAAGSPGTLGVLSGSLGTILVLGGVGLFLLSRRR